MANNSGDVKLPEGAKTSSKRRFWIIITAVIVAVAIVIDLLLIQTPLLSADPNGMG